MAELRQEHLQVLGPGHGAGMRGQDPLGAPLLWFTLLQACAGWGRATAANLAGAVSR